MECQECQIELPNGSKFCKECGRKLELTCPGCGKNIPPDSKFCLECGQQLAAKPAIGKGEALADAERKQVSALFSDLSGYTAMTERLDPEEVKEITGCIFDGVRAIVGKYDGFIERFAGDGVLALFGVPKSHEDDPVRAVRAAREIHELVDGMNPRYEPKVGTRLSMHSGVNTGLAVTADVDPEKGTHGVTGDAINVAAKLSDLAKGGDILVGPVTRHHIEGHFVLEALQPAKLKGKSEPISVYKVLARKEQPITVHRQSGLRADLIGRQAELVQMQEALENLQKGKGSVIAIYGDGGTGKSRLVEEFKASLDLDKIGWHEGHAYAYAQNIAYFPLVNFMNRAWKIEEGDPPATVRGKIESGLERLLGDKEQVAPYIGSLYALSYPEIEDVSPEFWRSRLFEGVQAMVAALTQHRPTVFCFEDIHWADPSTLDLLRYLISELSHPALFICMYRPPFSLFTSHQLNSLGKSYDEIRLQDLSPSDTQEMLKSLLKTESIPIELRKFIMEKTEGNPFYLEEMVNSLLESGTLAPENGDWKLTRKLDDSTMPATVQGVISARLDRLDREMKRVLQEASVIGRTFLFEILKKITEIQEPIDHFLNSLERLDLIRARSLEPELEYIFKHALTQEVVYKGLLNKDRQEIHERIGLVMEHLFQDRLTEFCETLAFHFKQGRSVVKAVDYLMKSGEKSLNRYAVEESHQQYQEAFNLLAAQLGSSNEGQTLIIDLLIEWSLVFYYRGDWATLERLLSAHEHYAVALEDKHRLGMFLAWLGMNKCWRGKYRESHDYLKRALACGEEAQDQKVIGYAAAWLSWCCAELGLLSTAIAYGQRALQISDIFPSDQYLYFKPLTGMAIAYFLMGDGPKAIDAGKKVLEYGSRHSNIRCIAMGHAAIGVGKLERGDIPSAIESLKRATQVALDPFYFSGMSLFLAVAQVHSRDFAGAEATLQNVVQYTRDFGIEWLGTVAQMCLGIIALSKGDMNRGLAMMEEVRQVWLDSGRRCFHASLENALGNVYLQIVLREGDLSLPVVLKNIGFLVKNVPGAANKAEAHFKKAVQIAEEIGAKGTLGRTYLDLGRLHKAKRRQEEARQCLEKAVEYFELCDAEAYLNQAREVLNSL